MTTFSFAGTQFIYDADFDRVVEVEPVTIRVSFARDLAELEYRIVGTDFNASSNLAQFAFAPDQTVLDYPWTFGELPTVTSPSFYVHSFLSGDVVASMMIFIVESTISYVPLDANAPNFASAQVAQDWLDNLVEVTAPPPDLGEGMGLLQSSFADMAGFSVTQDDFFFGHSGADAWMGSRGSDSYFGAGGNDFLDYSQLNTSIRADLALSQVEKRGGGTDSFSDISIINGSRFDDKLLGGFGEQFLLGDDGNDLIRMRQGNGQAFGDRGNDHLVGGVFSDLLQGDAGNDMLVGGAGNDTLYGDHDTSVFQCDLAQIGKDILKGGGGADVLMGGLERDKLYGNAGDDLLFGEWSNPQTAADRNAVQEAYSTLYTGGAVDLLFGGKGNDMLFGNFGNDQLYGGAGRDWLKGGEGTTICMAGAARMFLCLTGRRTVRQWVINETRCMTGKMAAIYWIFRPTPVWVEAA